MPELSKNAVIKIHEYSITLDVEDVASVSCQHWTVIKAPSGLVRFLTRCLVGDRFKTVTLARFIVGLVPSDRYVTLIDINDSFNYCRKNLAVVSRSDQGLLARKRSTPTTSKYKGVSYSRREKKWRAEIAFDGRRMRLGYFDDEDAAFAAYQSALQTLKAG